MRPSLHLAARSSLLFVLTSLFRPLMRPALAVVGSLLGYGALNSQRFVIERRAYALAGLQRPMRVVQLSDLHYGHWVSLASVRRWVRASNAQRPDLVVITGDFLDSGIRSRHIPQLMAELSQLEAPLGVYSVYGNHDWTSLNTHPVRARFAEQLRRAGVILLNNQGEQLRPDFYLCGIDDWWFGQQDMPAALSGYRGGACVLLSHNPDFLPYVPPAVTLTLCGHTHGGQVRVPFLGPLKLASLYGTRFLEGWVSATPNDGAPGALSPDPDPKRHIAGYVSRGLGVTGVPLRLNCPAELTVFEFVPQAQV